MAHTTDSKQPFIKGYEKLLTLNEKTSVDLLQQTLTGFVQNHSDQFEFKQFDSFVNKKNNDKIFTLLTTAFTKNDSNLDLQTSLLQTIRILSRSRIGADSLLTESFHKGLCSALKSSRRKLLVQTFAVFTNLCILSCETVQKYALEHETYNVVIDILMNKHNKMKKQEDKISYLGLHMLFYLFTNKEVGKKVYDNNAFFRWLFDLFLEKSKHFQNRSFWVRNAKTAFKNASANANSNSKNSKQKSNENSKKNENEIESKNDDSNVSEDIDNTQHHKLIVEILRILFNFTMVEEQTLKFKLDKFPPQYQRKVVGRAAAILGLPCNFEKDFDMGWQPKLSHLMDIPGLIQVKLNICNVSLYNGDILGMNIPKEYALPICHLLQFDAMQTRYNYQTQPNLCPILMFLKQVCKYNGKVRYEIKKYLFGSDADINYDSDEDDNDGDDKAPMGAKLDKVKGDETTLKNLLIQHCTSVNYSLKRSVGEFLFSVCSEDTKEFVRLCGLGNAIGTLVDKGLPGFAGAADNAVDLDQLTKMKQKQDQMKKNKKDKDDTSKEPKKKDDGNDGSASSST